jgi:hypothetical protein
MAFVILFKKPVDVKFFDSPGATWDCAMLRVPDGYELRPGPGGCFEIVAVSHPSPALTPTVHKEPVHD